MKLIGNILKTGFLASWTSLASYLILMILFQDIVRMKFFYWLIVGFFSVVTIGFSILFLCVPIVVFNKREIHGISNWIKSYLLIALIPFLIITVWILIEKPEVFKEGDFLIVFINCLNSFYASFILFFSNYK